MTSRNSLQRILCCLGLLALCLAPVLAGQTVDETRPASARVEVGVEIVSGSITVLAWDRQEVRIEGTIGDDVSELEIDGEGEEISISVDAEGGHGHGRRDISAELTLHVPTGASLEIEAVSAEIDVDGVAGALEIANVSGNVSLRCASVSIEISVVSGEVSLESSQPIVSAEIETVSGDILIGGDVAADGRIEAGSVSGRVTLEVPADISARFSLEAFSGSIKNAFGQKAQNESHWLPAQSLEFTQGDGRGRISAETFSGGIRIRHR